MLVVRLEVLVLRLFSDVCHRKPGCLDVRSQGQVHLHKLLAAEGRVKSMPLVIQRENSTVKAQKTGFGEFGTTV